MAEVGNTVSPSSHHGAVLESTSSAYELDLPPVPASLQLSESSSESSQRKQKWMSKLHGSGKAPRSALSPVVTTPELELSIIPECKPHAESDGDSSNESDSDTERVELYGNVTSLGMGRVDYEESQETDDKLYTHLRRSCIEEENHYATPSVDISTQSVGRSNAELMTAVNGITLYPHEASAGYPESSTHHLTSYVKVDYDSVDEEEDEKNSWKTRWARQKPSSLLKGTKRTWRQTLQRMSAVNMSNSTCLCTSHKQAKMFYCLLTGLVLLLLLALLGLLVGGLSWGILDNMTNSIEMEVETVNRSLETCRVGRNWVSIPLRSNSTPLATFQLRPNTRSRRIPLKDINKFLDQSRCKSEADPNQLLVYVVLRTILNDTERGSGYGELSPGSYTSVSLWTSRASREDCTFRQYMSIFNDDTSSQLASRSFWIPLRNTDQQLHMNAQLMEGAGTIEPHPINVTLYIAGYC